MTIPLLTTGGLAAIIERWRVAKLGGPGIVHVDGIDDPRHDVQDLICALSAPGVWEALTNAGGGSARPVDPGPIEANCASVTDPPPESTALADGLAEDAAFTAAMKARRDAPAKPKRARKGAK